MPDEEDVPIWRGIEIPPALEGRWSDIQDYLSRDDELMEAILKVLIYQTRLMQEGGEGEGVEKKTPLQFLQIDSIPIKSENFEQIEATKTLSPGEREEILEWNPFPHGIWWEVGMTSTGYSEYRYKVDEEYIFDEVQYEPLGTFTEPYRFPNPLLVDKEVILEVKREDDAPDDEDYTAKIRMIDSVPTDLLDRLKEAWSV